MIRFLFALLKITLLVAATVWLANHAGRVTLEWNDSLIELPALLLVALVVVLMLLSYSAAYIMGYMRYGVRLHRMHRHLRLQRRGEKMLGAALAAQGQGRVNKAFSFANKAEKLLGPSQGVALLKAQLAAPAALPSAKPEGALEEKMRQKNWDDALSFLDGQRGTQALSRKEARQAKAAILLERAREALIHHHAVEAFEAAMQADRLHPNWPPCLLVAAKALHEQGKTSAAAALIERSWPGASHKQLADYYLNLKTGRSDAQKAQTVERLVKPTDDHMAAKLFMAKAFVKAGMWGAARALLEPLVTTQPNREAFLLLAHIDETEMRDSAAGKNWRQKATEAPPDEAWVCQSCKQPHHEWQALCAGCSSFNRLQWGMPLYAGKAAGKAV